MQAQEYLKMFELEDSHFWFVGKSMFIKTVLAPYTSQIHRILDIGCGTGGQTIRLQQFGKVIGLELNDTAVKLARKRGLQVKRGTADHLPFRRSQFDLVTVLDVLYHRNVKSVAKIIKEARRVLKPHGYMLITDSAFAFLKSRHDEVMQGARRFRLKELKQTLEESGFKVKKASYCYFFIFPITVTRRLLTRHSQQRSDVVKLPKILNQILIYLLTLESKLLRYFNYSFGSSLIILAEKQFATIKK